MFWTGLKTTSLHAVKLVGDNSKAFMLSALPILILTYAGYALAYHYLTKFVPELMVLQAIQGMDPIKLDFVKNLTHVQQVNLFSGCLIFVTLLSVYYVGFTVQWSRYALYGEVPRFNLSSFRGSSARQFTLFMLLALFFFTIGMIVLQTPVWAVLLTGHQDWLSTRAGALGALAWICLFGGYLAWFLTKVMLITIPACGDQYQGLVREFKKLDDVFWNPFLSFVALLVIYSVAKLILGPLMWLDIVLAPIVGLLAYATAIVVAGTVYKTVEEKSLRKS